MMSLATIRELNRRATRKAAGVEPVIIEREDIEDGRIPRIPYIGYRTPRGWRKVTDQSGEHLTYFVDKTGWGSEGEPALTIPAFLRTIEPGLGYGVIEEGPFQVYVGAFRRVKR